MSSFSIRKAVFCTVFLLATLCLSGAENFCRKQIDVPYAEKVPHTADFDTPVWKNSPSYPLLNFLRTVDDIHRYPRERGTVQFLYNKEFFYAAFTMQDSDLVTESTRDHQHHYANGDVAELFLKSEKAPYFWEIYGTPNALTTCFFFPSRSHCSIDRYGKSVRNTGIKVVSTIDGTFNQPFDHDRGWRVLLIVPVKELEKNGMAFQNSNAWSVAVGRYNYVMNMPEVEFSTFPQVDGVFCDTERFAKMRLLPPPQEKRK